MRSRLIFNTALAAVGVATLLMAPPALGQYVGKAPQHMEAYDYTSPLANGQGEEYVASQHVVTIAGAPWLVLHFGHYDLGDNSYITITSLKDGETLRLNDRFMGLYNGSSCGFNGESLLITLHVAPGDENVFYSIAALTVGEWVTGAPESQCGPVDNRVGSFDDRVGRLYFGGCTAWTNNYGSLFSAGHCVDFDPDAVPGNCGPLLPDGVLDLTGVVEINIPNSSAGGTPVMAAADDQYPIDLSSADWRFDGCGQGLGKDWAIFRCNPNANTGITIHNAAGGGYFRLTDDTPSGGNTIRITGCGSDTGSDNFTLQTHSGPYVTENGSEPEMWHEYQVDTTGGNSGSPIIWSGVNSGLAIGIHTNAGCDNPLTGDGNNGTSMEANNFQSEFHNYYPGANEEYVDLGFSLSWMENPQNGHANSPWHNVFDAVSALPAAGGTVIVVEATYSNTAGNTGTMGADGKAFRIYAPVGSVRIGN